MFPDPTFVGTNVDRATGTVEVFLGRCDQGNLALVTDAAWRLLGALGGWVDIATNAQYTVYCWAQRF